MLLIVQFEDIYAEQPERLSERASLMAAHLRFLEEQGDRVVASGALRETEDGIPRGGLWILNMESKAAAEALYQEDPFWKAGCANRSASAYGPKRSGHPRFPSA